jgi:hypothetical protein
MQLISQEILEKLTIHDVRLTSSFQDQNPISRTTAVTLGRTPFLSPNIHFRLSEASTDFSHLYR